MDKKLKEEWVKALRSGEYEQANGSLQEDGRYCCLGVLNRVANRKMMYGFSELGINYPAEDFLVRMNDIEHKTFSEIASYIEANL